MSSPGWEPPPMIRRVVDAADAVGHEDGRDGVAGRLVVRPVVAEHGRIVGGIAVELEETLVVDRECRRHGEADANRHHNSNDEQRQATLPRTPGARSSLRCLGGSSHRHVDRPRSLLPNPPHRHDSPCLAPPAAIPIPIGSAALPASRRSRRSVCPFWWTVNPSIEGLLSPLRPSGELVETTRSPAKRRRGHSAPSRVGVSFPKNSGLAGVPHAPARLLRLYPMPLSREGNPPIEGFRSPSPTASGRHEPQP